MHTHFDLTQQINVLHQTMEDVPIPDSASQQILMSTVEVASQAFLLTLATLEVLVWVSPIAIICDIHKSLLRVCTVST